MNVLNLLKIIIIAVIFVYGCSKGVTEPVGVWKNVQAPEAVEFKTDHTGFFEVKDRPSLMFNWQTIENNQIRIDVNFQGTVRTLIGKVDGDGLVLEGSGQKATYSRIKQ